MLPRPHRLTRPEDFRDALRGGAGRVSQRAAGPLLVVHRSVPAQVTGETSPPARVGLVVSRAVGNSVVRHRVSRRLRALAADRLTTLPQGANLVIRALPSAAAADSASLGGALDQALSRLNR